MSPAKRKPGRPKKAARDKRQVVPIRLSPTEQKAVGRAAEAAGQPRAVWMRDALLRAAGVSP